MLMSFVESLGDVIAFLKNLIRKMRCNHDMEWVELIHVTKMADNIFPHSAAGESVLPHVWRRHIPTTPAQTFTTKDEIHGRQ